MASYNEEIKLTLDVDAAAAQTGLKNFGKTLQGVEGDENDTRTAGKKMADALHDLAGQMESDFAKSTKASEKLATALGKEGVAAVERQGQSVDDLVVSLRNAGLSYQDIEDDSAALADSLKRVADVGDSIDTHVTKNMEKVATETDRSRGVMANFTGNAIQELPGVAGAFGPLNMAIGQFGEYAAEGNIKLAGLAAQAGPMMGVGAAVWYANNQLQLMEKKDAFHSDRVKAYKDVVAESGDAVKNLADHLREVGKIEATTWTNNANPFADATVDITKKLQLAGLTVDQYAELVIKGRDAVDQWAAAQKDAGNSVDPTLLITILQDHKDYATAVDASATSLQFFGREQRSANELERAALQYKRDLITAENDLAGIRRNAADLQLAYSQSLRDLTAAYDTYNTTMSDGTLTQAEQDQALANLARQAIDSAKAYADLTGTQDTNNARLIGNLELQASTMEAGSPLRNAIESYIATLKGIPTDITTTVGFEVKGAHYVSGARDVKAYASGTNNAPGGPALVGDAGAELVLGPKVGYLPAGSQVIPADRTAAMLAAPATPAGPTAGEQAIIAAIRASSRATARAVVQALRAA